MTSQNLYYGAYTPPSMLAYVVDGNPVTEFFVESRGLVRTKTSDLLDERRYYTLGGNFSL